MEERDRFNSFSMDTTARTKGRPRYIGTVDGMASRTQICCFQDSIVNAATAIMERVFLHNENGELVPPHVPEEDLIAKELKQIFRTFARAVKRTTPVSVADYPRLNYTGAKRVLYERAARNLLLRGARDDDARLDTFIKHEKIVFKDKRLVPRVIQPRRPEYNVSVGRYIRQLEKPVFRILDSMWPHRAVMKGLDCFAQGELFHEAWSSFSEPAAVMLDAVRFDQHVSHSMLKWEHKIYGLFFEPHERRELRRLLSLQIYNRGRVRCPDGTIRYKVMGCRCSGDMNTSMGNCLIMCCLVRKLITQLGVRAQLFNNGDDCCVILERKHVDRLVEATPKLFSKFGFVIDIEGVTQTLEGISFCQTSPVFDGLKWRMVRNPRISLSKDATTLRRWSEKEYYAFWTAIGKCGLALTSGLPLLQSYYMSLTKAYPTKYGGRGPSEALLGHVSGVLKQSGMYYLSGGRTGEAKQVSDAARASFAAAFGILPDAQRYYESYFDSVCIRSYGLLRTAVLPLPF